METTQKASSNLQILFPGDNSICIFPAGVVDIKIFRTSWDNKDIIFGSYISWDLVHDSKGKVGAMYGQASNTVLDEASNLLDQTLALSAEIALMMVTRPYIWGFTVLKMADFAWGYKLVFTFIQCKEIQSPDSPGNQQFKEAEERAGPSWLLLFVRTLA